MTNSDWRYSDERMKLRQEVFLKLKHHFKLSEARYLYEFCHNCGIQGNTTIDNVEQEFLNFVELNK